jgi:ABC-type multidrug transport system ATPase subunit
MHITHTYIGFCPQTDPLFDLMTARETLWFYGRIRGIEPKTLAGRVETLITQVGLLNFADRTSGTYSGGNKRKLSLAISLIGSPKVLLLDEPSSGINVYVCMYVILVFKSVHKLYMRFLIKYPYIYVIFVLFIHTYRDGSFCP